jgi:hypothetical protein
MESCSVDTETPEINSFTINEEAAADRVKQTFTGDIKKGAVS